MRELLKQRREEGRCWADINPAAKPNTYTGKGARGGTNPVLLRQVLREDFRTRAPSAFGAEISRL
jgi:hypothetical protein